MDRKATSRPFLRARKAERFYSNTLLRLARHIDDIIQHMGGGDLWSLESTLRRYSETIGPWAASVGERMVQEVSKHDLADWKDVSKEISKGLSREIESTPVGTIVRARMAEQVSLIKSIPLEAAQRVHELATKSVVEGTRSEDLVSEIMRIGGTTKSRAKLIARTEVGRASVELTKARAAVAGSTHFIWRTVGDSDVRASHRRLDGKTFRWDDPPECDPGIRGLPGSVFNCRCIAEPLLTD